MLECGNVASIPRVEEESEKYDEKKKSKREQSAERKRGRKLMRKNVIRLTLCAMLFALSYSASAQQPKKIPLIGYLSNTDPVSESARSEAIRLALSERGYIEGQNIAIEYRYAEGKLDRLPELAAELVRLKVDIIVGAGGDTGDPGGQECDQDDSHRYDGRRQSCRVGPC